MRSRKQYAGMILLPLLAVIWLAPLPVRAEDPKDILVIVNKSASVDTLTKDDLKNLFLRKQAFWKRGGGTVVPVHAKLGSVLRANFLKWGLGMTTAEEDTYWRTSQIQKGVSRPVEFSKTNKIVFNLKRSISYIYRVDYKGVTKVVLILPAR